jgi:hypothetical protein
LVFGDNLPAEKVSETGGMGASGGESHNGEQPRELLPQVESGTTPNQADQGRSRSGTGQRRAGGFSVEFQSMGAEERRATYVPDERAIYVNLDHPQLNAVRGSGSITDPLFRWFSYEIAFTEYSIALSSELARHGEYLEPSDPIFEIRETINRLARKAASIFRYETK